MNDINTHARKGPVANNNNSWCIFLFKTQNNLIILGNGASGSSEDLLADEAAAETQNTSEKSEKPEAAPEKVTIYSSIVIPKLRSYKCATLSGTNSTRE